MSEPHCIYCDRGSLNDEHYLPYCLGRFKGYHPLSGKICEECNGKCGKLDEQLCRSSSAAFFRQYLGIKGRKKHKGKPSPFYRGSAGGERVQFKGKSILTGKTVELEYRDGQPVPLTHMLIAAEDGSTYILPIADAMKEPEDLKFAFKRLVGDKRANAEVYCTADEKERVSRLIAGLKFESQSEWGFDQGPTTFNEAEINFVVTERFFRAIAKIGFHHFLHKIAQFTGHEEQFKDIRDFIIQDGPLDRCKRFVSLRPTQLIAGLQRGHRLKRWAHLVTADVDYLNFTASVQLFAGPECIWPIYDVHLGRNPSRIDYAQHDGSFFCYYPKEERREYDGVLIHPPYSTVQRNW